MVEKPKQPDSVWFSLHIGNIKSYPHHILYFPIQTVPRRLTTTISQSEIDVLKGSRAELHKQLDSAIDEMIYNFIHKEN